LRPVLEVLSISAYRMLPSAEYANVVRPMSVAPARSPLSVIALKDLPPLVDL
jgi:hypothetical protein